jgi:hypothetical protein
MDVRKQAGISTKSHVKVLLAEHDCYIAEIDDKVGPEWAQSGSRGGPEGVQRGSRGGPEGVQRGSRGVLEGVQRGSRGMYLSR